MTDREPSRAGLRFARSLYGWVRVWIWCIGLGFLLALVGIAPSILGVIALTGPIWVVIVLLVLWGRMLDETMHFRSDMEDGPR